MIEATLPPPAAKALPAAKPPRTAAFVRAQAQEHFGWLAERSGFMELTAAECQEEARLGLLLVDEALKLLPNEVLDLQSFIAEHALDESQKSLAIDALGPLTGVLRLLRMEFIHPQAGKLPPAEVSALIESPLPRAYQGVVLTRYSVSWQFVRLPL